MYWFFIYLIRETFRRNCRKTLAMGQRPLTLHQELNCGLILLETSLRDVFMELETCSPIIVLVWNHLHKWSEHLVGHLKPLLQSGWLDKSHKQMKDLNNKWKSNKNNIKRYKKRCLTPLGKLKHLWVSLASIFNLVVVAIQTVKNILIMMTNTIPPNN